MSLSIAFIGFRHGHIEAVYQAASKNPNITIVAICEEDATTRESLAEKYTFTHTDYKQLLDEVDCDIIAVGDYYGKRGEIIINALKKDKHIISDKPICTKISELDEIEKLSREKKRSVFCQLDLRDSGLFQALKETLDSGIIGEVKTISFGGQHKLAYGSRADWYFEKGKHGGTINDIAVHGIDIISYLTGSAPKKVIGARAWNTRLPEVPHFQDAAQCMYELENGCGVMCDVSYLAPESFPYLHFYWRFTLYGTKGMIETQPDHLEIYHNATDKKEIVKAETGTPNGYLWALVKEIKGDKENPHLTTADVLQASRATLTCQKVADEGLTGVDI